MPKHEVRCLCGVLNRLPGYRVRQIPKCGACGAPLPEPTFIKSARAVYRAPVFMWVTGVAFITLMVWQPWRLPEPLPASISAPRPAQHSNTQAEVTSHPTAPTTELNDAIPNCLPAALPTHGLYRQYSPTLPVAPFTIKTEPGSSYLVKLQDATTGANVISFFVYGGQELQAKVPLGNYTLHYATGRLWCGDSDLFGFDTVVSAADSTLLFYRDGTVLHGKTVELILQVGGNLVTHRIMRSQF
jgi:hypothetical protein